MAPHMSAAEAHVKLLFLFAIASKQLVATKQQDIEDQNLRYGT